MQEMGLLLQKENEPKQEKNQQAPGLPCADSVVGGDCLLLWTLPLGGVSAPSGGGSGRRRALDAFPALYGEKMIAEQPWPSALGEMGLAYRFWPGVGMNWGQEPVLMAQRSPLRAPVKLGNATDPRAVGPSGGPTPLTTPIPQQDSCSGLSLVPLARPFSSLPFVPNLSAGCPHPAHRIQWPSLVCLRSRSLTSLEVDI